MLLDAGQSGAVVRNPQLVRRASGRTGRHCYQSWSFRPCRWVGQRAAASQPSYSCIWPQWPIYKALLPFPAKKRRYIGIPNTQEELSGLGAKWHLSEEPGEVLSGLMFSGTVPRRTAYEQGDSKLVVCGGCGGDCQDSIADDTSLYYRNKKGLVVLSGCAHAGLVNTVEHGFAVTGADKLLGWVGGTHLGPVGAEQQTKTLEQIEAYAPQFIAASHCTGFAMMSELSRRLGDRFASGMVGQVIEVSE